MAMKLIIGSLVVATFGFCVSSSEMMEMKCDEIKTISYYERYFGTKCTISDISADSGSTFVIRSANNFEYNKNIQEIEFSKSKLYDMPREIFATFQYLKKVQANSCGLEDVTKYNFNYAASLLELRMRSNAIKKLPNNVFSSITTLTTIDLSSNQISEIDKTAFANLENLEYLTLTNNLLVTIDEAVFKDLTSLISIRLDSNKLQTIEANLFVNNLNISEIRMDTNEIAVINGDVFSRLKKLKILNLASNRLQKLDIVNTNLERLWIPYNKFKALDVNKNLKQLHAPYNDLEEINFTGNTEMVELKLRQNFIANISNFSGLNKLEVLDLSFNPIGDLPISSFARMNELAKLNLESTNLTSKSLTFGTFAHNKNMSQLDISYNQLKQLDFNIFTSLNQLTHLKIDGNNLTDIPYANLKGIFPKLSLVSFVDNDWNCSYLSGMIKQLHSMNVIVYVFAKFRIYDDTNVEGIRCHNNKTDHVYWKNARVHRDDNEIYDASVEREDGGSSIDSLSFTANFTKIWKKISDIQLILSKMGSDLKENQALVSKISVNQEIKAEKQIDDLASVAVQSEVSSIRVILFLILLIMLGFTIGVVIKYGKPFFTQKRFYDPSKNYQAENFRRSTATIQTTMEDVL